ncbi:hypothetical protein [Pseudomonas sp. OHS18]|uniref:hypothetical protein n=1 Tax=Pseudomonas sp. OHS18 TaxID=3399679 RepID=UPI003A87BCC7
MASSEDLEALKEQLAAIEHARWSHWQKYMHKKCIRNSDGSLTIPKELVVKWDNQSRTVYADLTEKEKQSDREQVDKYLPLLKNFFQQLE